MIMVKSNTYAYKSKTILESRGFKVYVDKTPKKHDPSGCGFTVHVTGDADMAADIMTSAGITILGRYDKD